MKNRTLFVVVMLLISVYIFIKPESKTYSKLKHIVDNKEVINNEKLKLENYIIGVVAAEMPATFSSEALKAQAVAARTFAFEKLVNKTIDINDIENDKGQAYISKEEMKEIWKDRYEENYKKISNAVIETRGEIITYNDKPIKSYYFSMSNGKTEESKNVFGELNYLVSVDSSWDKNVDNYIVEKKISKEDFINKIELNSNNIEINEIKRNDTNHVEFIVINNIKISGIEFRKKLELRSTDFDINILEDYIIIKTRGYGHGVGMSQYGANAMALEGKKYNDILNYYYHDIKIKKL